VCMNVHACVRGCVCICLRLCVHLHTIVSVGIICNSKIRSGELAYQGVSFMNSL